MDKVLFINACARPNSRTHILAQSILDKLNGTVEVVNLYEEKIQPLKYEILQERDALVKEKKLSSPILKHAIKFAEADKIVIAAPYWDLSFPAIVKTYIENITVIGVTFNYTSDGYPNGLCKAKKLIYVTSAGGMIDRFNLGFDYIKTLAENFYGIKDVICFKAENLDVIGADVENILKKVQIEIKKSDI